MTPTNITQGGTHSRHQQINAGQRAEVISSYAGRHEGLSQQPRTGLRR